MYNILVLAGGGAMGLMQLRALEYIERQTGKKICDVFDLIVGSSVGAINGGVLASGISANEFMPIFYKNLEKIFDERFMWWARRIPKYDRKNFIDVYKKIIDEDFMMHECKTDFMCTSVNRVDDKNYFFKSRKTNETLLQCMLRSFAAPMFFGQKVDKKNKAVWFDGGTGTANMPLDWAFTEAVKIGMLLNDDIKNQQVRITAIGTGFVNNRESFNKLAKEGTGKQVSEYLSVTSGGLARKQVIVDQVNRMEILEEKIKELEFRYIDVEVKSKHAGLDLIKYKDNYINYGDKMINLIEENNWKW